MINPMKPLAPAACVLTQTLIMVLIMAMAAGCAGIRNKYQEKKTYRLSADPLQARDPDPAAGDALLVKRFSIAPEFEASTFMYRIGQDRFTSDFYHNYVVPPARMITDLTMEALYASPMFSPVSPNAMDDIQYRLWGKIIDIYGDARDKHQLKSVITIRLVLDKNTGKRFDPVRHATYTAGIPMAEPSPDAYITGLNQGLTQILEAFFRDISDAGTVSP
ncbi:MAG: ABC transporter [Desulfobacter sp.]